MHVKREPRNRLGAMAYAVNEKFLVSTRLLSTPSVRKRLTFLLFAGSWVLLAWCVVAGIGKIPNEIVGGGYSNTDGEWLRWNAEFILRFGNLLDPSPFNAFAGMGSIYLPNLPWFNPGALALGLPLDRMTAIQVSYLLYMLQVGLSIVILARALGLSCTVGTIAAQLHIVVLFPPFSFFFYPIEWYSAAPIYAQLSMVLNLAMAVFIIQGRRHKPWRAVIGTAAFAVLTVIGLFSAPFSFVFFFVPYIFLGLVIVLFSRPDRHEIIWKLSALIAAALIVLLMGFPDYLQAMAGVSARTPHLGINWSALLSPHAWLALYNRYHLCSDPRTLICGGNSVAWLQIVAAFGALVLLILGRGMPRNIGIWGIVYTIFVVGYAYLFNSRWLGTIGFVSIHFVSWSSYSLLCLCAIGGVALLLRRAVQLPAAMRPVIREGGGVKAVLAAQLHDPRQRLPFVTALVAAVILITLGVFVGKDLATTPSNFSRLATGGAIRLLLGWAYTVAAILLTILFGADRIFNLSRRQTTSVGDGNGKLRFFARFTALAVLLLPIAALKMLPALSAHAAPLDKPRSGPILNYLRANDEMRTRQRFPRVHSDDLVQGNGGRRPISYGRQNSGLPLCRRPALFQAALRHNVQRDGFMDFRHSHFRGIWPMGKPTSAVLRADSDGHSGREAAPRNAHASNLRA